MQDEDVRLNLSLGGLFFLLGSRRLLCLGGCSLQLGRIFSGRGTGLLTCNRNVVGMSKCLELLRFSPTSMLNDQPLQLLDRVEQVHTSAAIRVCWLEEPHVVPVEERVAHRQRSILPLLLIHCTVLLNVTVHSGHDLLLLRLALRLRVCILRLFNNVKVVGELVELLLAQGRAEIKHEGYGYHVEDVLVHVLAQFGHTLNQLVLCRDERMVLEVIHKVLLAMLAQKIELNLP